MLDYKALVLPVHPRISLNVDVGTYTSIQLTARQVFLSPLGRQVRYVRYVMCHLAYGLNCRLGSLLFHVRPLL
jgi:hypothetical protein